MNDTSTPAKNEPAQPAKTTKPAVSKAAATIAPIKTPLLNPAWVSDMLKVRGFSSPLLEPMAQHITEAITEQLEKVTHPDKLTKLVKEAANDCIGIVR